MFEIRAFQFRRFYINCDKVLNKCLDLVGTFEWCISHRIWFIFQSQLLAHLIHLIVCFLWITFKIRVLDEWESTVDCIKSTKITDSWFFVISTDIPVNVSDYRSKLRCDWWNYTKKRNRNRSPLLCLMRTNENWF